MTVKYFLGDLVEFGVNYDIDNTSSIEINKKGVIVEINASAKGWRYTIRESYQTEYTAVLEKNIKFMLFDEDDLHNKPYAK